MIERFLGLQQKWRNLSLTLAVDYLWPTQISLFK